MSFPPTFAGRLARRLDRLHLRVRSSLLPRYFASVNRILLAVGFIPPGLIKVRGERFTSMDLGTDVGFFFEAMYRTGAYWQFLGWAQVLAGVLLLMRGTSLLGALLFFPVILNIFVITLSMDFHGTHVVTGGMLLANLYLLCWDWHRLKPLFFAEAVPVSLPAPVEGSALATRLEWLGYGLATAGGLLVWLWTRSLVPRALVLPSLAVGLLGGVLMGVSLVLHWRGQRAGVDAAPVA